MQAYEFYAVPQNGRISIPNQYKNKITKKVKVILLDENFSELGQSEATAPNRTDLLSPITIDTCGWKFDKEEANER